MVRTLVLAAWIALGAAQAFAEDPAAAAGDARLGRIRAMVTESQSAPDAAARGKAYAAEAPDGMSGSWLAMIEGLLLCVGGFLVVVHVLKRRAKRHGPAADRRLSVIERVPLSAKTTLALVSIDGSELLVALGSEQVAFSERVRRPDADAFEFEPQTDAARAPIVLRQIAEQG